MADEAAAPEAAPGTPAPEAPAVETPATDAPPAKGERGADGKFAKKADAPLEQADWRKDLPDDLRKAADKFSSPTDTLKAYSEAEKRLSRSIVRPGKDAAPEDKAAFQAALRREMGHPEKLEDYKVDIPTALAEDPQTMEGIQTLLGKFHELGVPASAASYAIQIHQQLVETQHKALVAEVAESLGDAEMELRREYGADFEANKAIAQTVVAKYADDKLLNLFKMTGKELAEALGNRRLGDLAPLTRMMAKVGRATGESQTVYQRTGEASGLLDEATRLTADKDYWLDPAKQKRVSDIYGTVYGRGHDA